MKTIQNLASINGGAFVLSSRFTVYGSGFVIVCDIPPYNPGGSDYGTSDLTAESALA